MQRSHDESHYLTQPWAQLVAIGAKKIETRSWNTKYRGPLAIHAAKGFPQWAQDCCYMKFFYPALYRFNPPTDLPTGVVIATCELVNVVRIEELTVLPGNPEWAFGDYRLKRYMWLLENIVPLPAPIPAKGALGLWEVDNEIF